MTQTQSPTGKRDNWFERFKGWLDKTQQRHHTLSFPYAVIKKYGDDKAGHQAALMTYYGFLSLFPLLLVATSTIDLIAQHNSDLRAQLVDDINRYFPIAGHQLQASVHSNKTGLALAIGLLFAIYGTRGIADAVRSALDHVWAVPRVKRTGFPKSLLKSLGLLFGAGIGLLLTTTLVNYALATLGNLPILRTVPILINAVLLYLIFMYVFLIGTSGRHSRKDRRLGAAIAAVCLLVLQQAGFYLVKHQLHNLQGFYGQFALVLALLFWIYLQAQVFMYAIEINVVHTYKLWPRSFTQKLLTEADQKAFRMYAEKEAYRPKSEEQIEVTFKTPAARL